ncbi:hypothetical protein GH714_036941 [Hevea brasiliensis]|uniref:Uncharacterized protein n=1 Tax=Hevea brasiliensis TaxID=3981 RepID=A0A6A6KMM7_HEVBR|nr:hypothetical protein GH714_036941 [Hevea brasiliensis]
MYSHENEKLVTMKGEVKGLFLRLIKAMDMEYVRSILLEETPLLTLHDMFTKLFDSEKEKENFGYGCQIGELPNDVLQHLNVVLMDSIVLNVGRPQPHQWTVRIQREENGNRFRLKKSDLMDVINHYSVLTTSPIDSLYFKDIQPDSMSLFLFNANGMEICYGPHPGEEIMHILLDDECEGNPNGPMFTACMTTCDWQYKLDNLGIKPKEIDLWCPMWRTNFKVKYVPRVDNKGRLSKGKFEKGWGQFLRHQEVKRGDKVSF